MDLTSYRKTVRLRAESVEHARPLRTALDERVFHAVSSLTSQEPKLQVTRSCDERGNSSILASANGYDLTISTRSGQDSVFQGGERRSFISYTVSASSRLKSLDRAATVSREITVTLRIGGGMVFGAGFLLAIWGGMGATHMHHIHLPIFLIVAIVTAGAWVGERVGSFIGDRVESGATARAERNGALPQLNSLWASLKAQFDAVLGGCEAI